MATYKVIAKGHFGRIYDPSLKDGQSFTTDRKMPKASWYKKIKGEKSKSKKKPNQDNDVAGGKVSQLSEIGDPVQKQSRLEALTGAYRELDPSNDDDWTQAGLVNLDSLNAMHEGDSFSRKDVPAEMTRENLLEELSGG